MNYLEQNLAIVQERDPDLAALMRSDLDCHHIQVLDSHQPGVPTARVTLPSGESVLLHNLEDPIGSAVRSAARRELLAENGTILLGMGLGYLALELVAKMARKHTLIICEADPAVLKVALMSVDLAAVLDSDYVRILVGPDIPLQTWIHRLGVKFMTAKVEVIGYEPGMRLHPEAYARLKDIAQKESRAIALNRNTTLKAGRRLMENFLMNVPEVLESAGVRHLENLFQGRPAVMVAAGPSLEKNVTLLRQLQGRAVIIAVDTALRLLLPLGIKPDFVATIDFNRANFEKFNAVPIDPDIALVYHPGGYYESLQVFHGPRFTQSRTPNRIPTWIMGHVEDKGMLPPGTTVAHMAFHLARHLGCDPIVMIGQDLAFPNDKMHAADLSLWQLRAEDCDTTEDIFGEPVKTMGSFLHAVYHFEKAFQETRATVIDATEAGAKKQGARVMRLEDVVAEYGQLPPIDIKGLIREQSTHVETVQMDELLRDMRAIRAELVATRKLCDRLLKVIVRLQKKIGKNQMDDAEFGALTLQAERLTQEMDTHGRVLHLMGEQNYALELYMMQHQIASIDEVEAVDEKVVRQVERGWVFYTSVNKAAKIFQGPLERLIHRLAGIQALQAQPLPDDSAPEAWYQRALAYQKYGHRRGAWAALQQALAQDPDYVPALKVAARLSLSCNRLVDAQSAMAALRRLKMVDHQTQDLMRETDQKTAAWQERCRRLTDEFRDHARPGTLEEAGWFYYRAKEYSRALAKFEQVVASRPTADAWAKLGLTRVKLGDDEGALQAWEACLSLDSTRADVYAALARVLLKHGLTDPAVEFFIEAVRREPDDAESCEQLAGLLLQRGEFIAAASCYENLLRLQPERLALATQIAAIYQRQMAGATTQ